MTSRKFTTFIYQFVFLTDSGNTAIASLSNWEILNNKYIYVVVFHKNMVIFVFLEISPMMFNISSNSVISELWHTSENWLITTILKSPDCIRSRNLFSFLKNFWSLYFYFSYFLLEITISSFIINLWQIELA